MFYPSSPTPTPSVASSTPGAATAQSSAAPSVASTAYKSVSAYMPSLLTAEKDAPGAGFSVRDQSADAPDVQPSPAEEEPDAVASVAASSNGAKPRCPRGTRRNKRTGECKAVKRRKSSKASSAISVANEFALSKQVTLKGRVSALEDGYLRLAAKVSSL